MFGLKKSEADNSWIDVKKLREPKLKGTFSIGFLIRLSGFFDEKKGLVRMDGAKISSPWIARKQTCYNRYSAEMYKVAGAIVKEAYIQREKVNDELKKLKKELQEAKAMVSTEAPQTIEEKRKEAYAKRHVESTEEEMTEKLSILKEIKISIDEAEHELNQILQEKKLVVEAQILNYIRGAKKMSAGSELLVENEISKSLYNTFGNGFEYCMNVEKLLQYEEKESGEDEHIQ